MYTGLPWLPWLRIERPHTIFKVDLPLNNKIAINCKVCLHKASEVDQRLFLVYG